MKGGPPLKERCLGGKAILLLAAWRTHTQSIAFRWFRVDSFAHAVAHHDCPRVRLLNSRQLLARTSQQFKFPWIEPGSSKSSSEAELVAKA